MHQSFVSTATLTTGMGGDSDFHFSEPWYKPRPVGTIDGNNPTLSPAIHYRKSHRGKCPNVITPALPWHCGGDQKVLALHHSPPIPPLSP